MSGSGSVFTRCSPPQTCGRHEFVSWPPRSNSSPRRWSAFSTAPSGWAGSPEWPRTASFCPRPLHASRKSRGGSPTARPKGPSPPQASMTVAASAAIWQSRSSNISTRWERPDGPVTRASCCAAARYLPDRKRWGASTFDPAQRTCKIGLGRASGPVTRAGFKPVGGRQASSVGSTPASSAVCCVRRRFSSKWAPTAEQGALDGRFHDLSWKQELLVLVAAALAHSQADRGSVRRNRHSALRADEQGDDHEIFAVGNRAYPAAWRARRLGQPGDLRVPGGVVPDVSAVAAGCG